MSALTTSEKRGSSGLKRMERNWGVLMAMPAILGFVIFTIGPMIASFFIGLTDWTIGGSPRFVGLENYKTMFTDDSLFYQSLSVTLYYALGGTLLLLVVAFAVALLLKQDVRGLGVFRTVYYLPTLVPFVASAILWVWIFDTDFGLLNSILETFGLPTSEWIRSTRAVVPSLILMHVWAFGNAALIFLAGLQGVPRHLYDAVAVDGGTAWHKLRHVTFPLMTPTIFFNLVTGLILAVQEFVRPYLMTEGGPSNASLMYVYYIWRTAFQESRLGYASALSWILFAIILVITVIIFRTAKHWVYYETGEGR